MNKDSLGYELGVLFFKDGFLSEAENYEIERQKALILFKKAKQRVIDF